MKKFTFQTATTIMNEFWFLSRIMTQGSSSLLEAQVLTWLNVQLRETHWLDLVDLVVIPKGTRGNPLSINGQKGNHLYEVRSFMCQKDLGILQCGRRQRRFNLSLDCMWCGWAISQGVYKCKRNDNALRKRLEGKFILSHYYFYCIYKQLCVMALNFLLALSFQLIPC